MIRKICSQKEIPTPKTEVGKTKAYFTGTLPRFTFSSGLQHHI